MILHKISAWIIFNSLLVYCHSGPTFGRTCDPSGLPHKLESSKRNVFMSRGWGAAGMPYNMLFLTPQIQHQNYQSKLNIPTLLKHELRRSAVHLDERNLKPFAEYLIQPLPSQEELMQNDRGIDDKKERIIPQLFVSYGWGPIGK